MGEAGLQHSMTKERLERIKGLEQEVELLKQSLAEKEIESNLIDESLKKRYPKVRRKSSQYSISSLDEHFDIPCN